MNKYKLTLIILGFIFLFSGINAQAQETVRIDFKTDFDFYIADKKFEAGDYTIEQTNSASEMYLIRRNDGKANAIFSMMSEDGRQKKGKNKFIFLFKQYGNKRYLNTISNEALAFKANLKKTTAEIELARQFVGKRRAEVAVNTQCSK